MNLDIQALKRLSSRDARLLTLVTTAIPVWNFYGFAINFFRDTWADASIPVIPISYGLNAGFVLLLPFVRYGGRTELRVAALLGSAMAVWSAVGMVFSPASKLPYTGVPTVLGAATASLAVRGLMQKRRAELEPKAAASLPPRLSGRV